MNIRIQTYSKSNYQCREPPRFTNADNHEEGNAVDALKKGLVDLQEVCDVVADEFWTKRQTYNAEQGIDR